MRKFESQALKPPFNGRPGAAGPGLGEAGPGFGPVPVAAAVLPGRAGPLLH